MSGIWAWFLTTKVGRWIVGIGALLLVVGTAMAVAFVKGRKAQANDDMASAAQDAIRQANQTAAVNKDRQEVQRAIDKLPDAPAQRVGDAKSGTAAGDLRRWVRDVSDHDPS